MSRRRSGDALVFSVATALVLVHALDDAIVGRQPGIGAGQHLLAAVIAIVAGVGGAIAFPSLRPGLRATLAFAFGGLALVNGLLHVGHIATDGPAHSDLTGVLAAIAGAVLIGLAATIPWRHRRERSTSTRRRWAIRLLTVPAAFVGMIFVLGPIGMAIVETHKWREPIGAPPSAAYEEVSFGASDGIKLAGWYRPSRNGASVVVVHGGGSDRSGSVAHASMLARHGYGVLLYDARGRGESEGTPNNYGWDWGKDVAGALDFLARRDDVEPGRIGALGLSTGADVLIEVAAERSDVHALVADGAAAGSFEDWHHLKGTDVVTAPGWMMFTAMRVMSGDPPGPPLEDLIGRVKAPTLLISAGTDVERDFNVIYDEAARGPVEHWNLPDADHTRSIRKHPAEYERRVVGLFNEALL
jgi:uncharacterized protein